MPEAVPAPLLNPALMPRVLLPAARACYGAALLCAPGLALGLFAGQAPSRRARAVTRILGARHLAQAVLTLWRPRPAVFLAGAGVDACHAASMLALAVADPRMRRAGVADAVTAAAFSTTSALTGADALHHLSQQIWRSAQLRSRRRNVTSCNSSRRAAAAGIATSAPTMPISAPPTSTATNDTTAGTFTVLPMIRGTSR